MRIDRFNKIMPTSVGLKSSLPSSENHKNSYFDPMSIGPGVLPTVISNVFSDNTSGSFEDNRECANLKHFFHFN